MSFEVSNEFPNWDYLTPIVRQNVQLIIDNSVIFNKEDFIKVIKRYLQRFLTRRYNEEISQETCAAVIQNWNSHYKIMYLVSMDSNYLFNDYLRECFGILPAKQEPKTNKVTIFKMVKI